MNSAFFNTVRLGFKSLLLHKLRSGLTMLGIIFGVSSVIIMLAVGEGASFAAQEQIKGLGSQNIIIKSVKPPGDDQTTSQAADEVITYGITDEDVLRLATTIPQVDLTVPVYLARKRVRFDQLEISAQIIGSLPEYREVRNLKVIAGRFLVENDEVNQANVCVISEALARRLFVDRDPLRSAVRVGQFLFPIVGIAVEGSSASSGKGAEAGESFIIVPLSTARVRFGGEYSRERVDLHQVLIRMKGPDEVLSGEVQVRHLMERFHQEKDYELVVPLQLLREAEASKRMFNLVLGSIAAISLIVGGIGIMNIMLATVTERTREIGIRRALGAKRRDIITQFLIETVVLTVIGGVTGVILGLLGPSLITTFAGMVTIITMWSVVLAFSISVLTGIIFGLYPAFQAAKLDPIEALRQE